MGILTPYITYIKIAAVAAALIGAGWIGHEWTRRGYEADNAKALATANAEYAKSVDQYKSEIYDLQERNDEATGKFQSRITALTTDNQKLTRNIANATKNQPACTFTAGFDSVWNDSIKRANGGVPAGTEDTTSAASADGRVTTLTRADLLTNHDAVVQQCGKWKAQLDSIIEWDKNNK